MFTLQLGELRSIPLTNPTIASWAVRIADADIAGARNLVASRGLVLLSSTGTAAVRQATGEIVWAVPSPSARYQAGRTAADSIRFIVPRGDGTVVAYDIATGTLLWSTPAAAACPFDCRLSGVVISGDTVYVAGIVNGNAGGGLASTLVTALDRNSGALLWREVDPTLEGGVNTPPVVAGRLLLLGSLQGWYFGGFDRFTRQWQWRRRAVNGGPYQTIGVAGDSIVLTGADPVIYLLSAATGASLMEARTRGSMYEAQFCGSFVISLSPELRWFDMRSGQLIAARLPEDGGFTQALTVSGDTAIVITSEGSVAAYPCTP
ncbi:MAG: PQQ-binding-like beta-propeller repeat protein [Gemmatimonadetes bacterium]|nr:PQQ-binding-like beta-propeller repeat protein [Gemmatimonadota bacterium]